ncbi:hypothetical protein HDE_01338 [Halotydeus destructor]|nr:hypothetical protein HDE_01338 [Halotydeus destructor]
MPTETVWIVITVPKAAPYTGADTSFKIRNDLKLYTAQTELSKKTWEQVLEICLKNLGIGDTAIWMPSKDDKRVQVYFTVDLFDNDATLNYLNSMGFGMRKGTEGAQSEPKKTASSFKKAQDDFLKSVTSRLTVTQVVEGVKGASQCTFDFIMYTVYSCCIAAAGIMSSSPIDVAASMCIEPVMATVLAGAFGTVVKDWSLIKIGIRNNFIVLFICLVMGFVYALIGILWAPQWNVMWPTSEMVVRGLWKSLWYGALQAAAAGGAVALSLLNNNQCAIVGVAVASTFMPPFLNTGILWAYTCHLSWRGMGQEYQTYNISGNLYRLKEAWAPMEGYAIVYYPDMRWECMYMSYISALYTYVNVACLYLFCVLTLKLKEVAPLGGLEPNKRFFQEDIPKYREYNQQQRKSLATGMGTGDNMGSQILREWAKVAGLDPNVLLSDRPEARITQLQTLRDLVQDIENDQVYNTVTRNIMGQRSERNLLRRLTSSNIYAGSAADLRSRSATDPSYRDGGEAEMGVYYTNTSGRRLSTTRLHPDDVMGGRGLRPREFETNRRASIALQRKLREAPHSPYSMWPNANGSKDDVDQEPRSRFTVSEVRQRSGTRRSSNLSEANDKPDYYTSTKF